MEIKFLTDTNGNLLEQTDAKLQAIANTCDAPNRTLTKDHAA